MPQWLSPSSSFYAVVSTVQYLGVATEEGGLFFPSRPVQSAIAFATSMAPTISSVETPLIGGWTDKKLAIFSSHLLHYPLKKLPQKFGDAEPCQLIFLLVKFDQHRRKQTENRLTGVGVELELEDRVTEMEEPYILHSPFYSEDLTTTCFPPPILVRTKKHNPERLVRPRTGRVRRCFGCVQVGFFRFSLEGGIPTAAAATTVVYIVTWLLQ